LFEWIKENYQPLSTIINATSGVLVALFTGFVWWLQRQSYASANYAKVKIAATHGELDLATRKVTIEFLLLNTYQSPAVITSWSILIKQGNNQEDATRSPTQKSKKLKAVGNVQGQVWALKRESPLALCVEHQLSNANITSGATVQLDITFSGGKVQDENITHKFTLS